MAIRNGIRAGLALVTALLLAPAAARAITPTAITFSINHADCAGAGSHRFGLFMNGTLLRSVSTTEDCTCNDTPLVVTFTDATTLSRFNPNACNAFRVDVSDFGSAVVLATVRVTVSTATASFPVCLLDGFPGNPDATCADRNTCDGAGFTMDLASVGPDTDGDGVAEGVGHGCDNC